LGDIGPFFSVNLKALSSPSAQSGTALSLLPYLQFPQARQRTHIPDVTETLLRRVNAQERGAAVSASTNDSRL
jgi:hypothetical protein